MGFPVEGKAPLPAQCFEAGPIDTPVIFEFGDGLPGHDTTGEDKPAVSGDPDPSEAEQRVLAGTRRTDDSGKFPFFYFQINAIERVHRHLCFLVHFS